MLQSAGASGAGIALVNGVTSLAALTGVTGVFASTRLGGNEGLSQEEQRQDSVKSKELDTNENRASMSMSMSMSTSMSIDEEGCKLDGSDKQVVKGMKADDGVRKQGGIKLDQRLTNSDCKL